jgi:hypothetical protein
MNEEAGAHLDVGMSALSQIETKFEIAPVHRLVPPHLLGLAVVWPLVPFHTLDRDPFLVLLPHATTAAHLPPLGVIARPHLPRPIAHGVTLLHLLHTALDVDVLCHDHGRGRGPRSGLMMVGCRLVRHPLVQDLVVVMFVLLGRRGLSPRLRRLHGDEGAGLRLRVHLCL